jgi:putative ABC transport system permease protein
MRNALVVAEIALAVVLLVGAAVFMGSFAALMRIDPGFDTHNVLTAGVYPRFQPVGANRLAAATRRRPSSSSPNVSRRFPASRLPQPLHLACRWQAECRAIRSSERQALGVGERSMGDARLPPGTRYAARPRTLVRIDGSQGCAQRRDHQRIDGEAFFPGEDPVGRSVEFEGDRRIVGVVGDVHQFSLEVEPRAEAYMPIAQSEGFGADLVIRTSGDPYDVMAAVKSVVHRVLPDVPLRGVRTMEQVLARRVAQRKLNMLLLG